MIDILMSPTLEIFLNEYVSNHSWTGRFQFLQNSAGVADQSAFEGKCKALLPPRRHTAEWKLHPQSTSPNTTEAALAKCSNMNGQPSQAAVNTRQMSATAKQNMPPQQIASRQRFVNGATEEVESRNTVTLLPRLNRETRYSGKRVSGAGER